MKQNLTLEQSHLLRDLLQVATLDAICSFRRWRPKEMVFQGGTCLHLAHGSPRFSEDLDFLLRREIQIENLEHHLETRLASIAAPLAWLPKNHSVSVKKSREDKNPATYMVSLGSPDLLGSVKVKVEFWRVDPAAVDGLSVSVVPVQTSQSATIIKRAQVPSLSRQEIMADKAFAMGARPYIKPRDIYDIHWLMKTESLATSTQLQDRLLAYPGTILETWLSTAQERVQWLSNPENQQQVHADIIRWLPAAYPWELEDTQAACATSKAVLSDAAANFSLLVQTEQQEATAPRP